MIDWLEEHDSKLKIASVVVALLILLVSIYRWMLLKWRSDVSMRKYAFFHSLPSSRVSELFHIRIDVPEEQEIQVLIINSSGTFEEVYNKLSPEGDLALEINMNGREKGTYEILMITSDQQSMKKIIWSGK